MDRKLLSYLPPVMWDFREMQAITDGQQRELQRLWNAVDDVFADQFVDDATENGIARWEDILAITPRVSQTLEERRAQVRRRLLERLPYTERVLRRMLDRLCGEGGYTLELPAGSYEVWLQLSHEAGGSLGEVQDMLLRILPANLMIRLGSTAQTATVPILISTATCSGISSVALPLRYVEFNAEQEIGVMPAAGVVTVTYLPYKGGNHE